MQLRCPREKCSLSAAALPIGLPRTRCRVLRDTAEYVSFRVQVRNVTVRVAVGTFLTRFLAHAKGGGGRLQCARVRARPARREEVIGRWES